jgi:hypothetical protein
MKGSITTTDVVGVLGVTVLVMVFVSQIFPTIFSTIIESFSKSSAENVARQLSNLITVSGSAPYEVEIIYAPAKDVLYDIFIGSRAMGVMPKFKAAYAEKSSSIQPFAVNLPDSQHSDVNSFLIKKDFSNGESRYVFNAKKE